MLKPHHFLCFVIFAGVSVESFAQRIFWTERNNNRIMVGNLSPTGISGISTFITGLNGPVDLAVDLAGNRLFYTNNFAADLLSANLTTGAPVATVVTNGAMVYYEDIDYSENSDAVYGVMNTDVDGVYFIPADNNDSGTEFSMNLNGFSNDYFTSGAVYDGFDQIFLIDNSNQSIMVTDDLNGTNATAIYSISGMENIALDKINNKILFTLPVGPNNQIGSVNFDGSSATILATVSGGQITSIRAYPQFGKIYYVIDDAGLY